METYGKRINIKNPFKIRRGWELFGFSAAKSIERELLSL